MTKRIVIVGAGGMGREIFNWLQACESEITVIGFIDDNLHALDGFNYESGVISRIEGYIPNEDVHHVLAIMNPLSKKNIVSYLKIAGSKFYRFIHPTAIIGTNVQLGEGTVITPGCILTCDIRVGDFVFLNTQTTLGHDVRVGDFTSINGKVEISGYVEIGNEVIIGSRVVVLPKKRIASKAVIGAGSVVAGNINKPITVFGNPARRLV
mgnify:CR=1 FL=1|jgi:sugar O-acyltransferase (sialic acid O-acetyltransferase NeuD family)|tara:strand:- start:327 stop:953 length:627 start_codon:yes stop_codon:yes gene_type:complete